MTGEVLQRPAGQGAITLALGLGQTVAFASSFYLLGVLGDPIARDLRLAPTFIFSLMSLALLATALAAPAAGQLIDARGGKPVLLASSLVFAAGLVLIAQASGAWVLGAGIVILGVGMALGLYGTPFAILVALYGDEARRPITGVALLGGLGSSLGWPITLWLEESFGWRGACLAWAGLHLCVCLPLTAWITPHARAVEPPVQAHHEPVRWDRRMIQLAALFAGAWFVSACVSAHLPRLLAAFGLSPRAAVATASLVGLAAVTVRFLEFTVFRRFAPLMATRVATLMHPLGGAFVMAFGVAAAPALALGQGAGNGMLTVAKGVLPLSLYGPRNYAYRSALLSRPAQFAQIGGPALYGLAIDRSPQLALGLSSAICLVMFAMTWGLGSPAKPDPEASNP
jgi:cyanate permease